MAKRNKKSKWIKLGLILAPIAILIYFYQVIIGFVKSMFTGQAVPLSKSQAAIRDAWVYYGGSKVMPLQRAFDVLASNRAKAKQKLGDGGGWEVDAVNLTDWFLLDTSGRKKAKYFAGGNPTIVSKYGSLR